MVADEHHYMRCHRRDNCTRLLAACANSTIHRFKCADPHQRRQTFSEFISTPREQTRKSIMNLTYINARAHSQLAAVAVAKGMLITMYILHRLLHRRRVLRHHPPSLSLGLNYSFIAGCLCTQHIQHKLPALSSLAAGSLVRRPFVRLSGRFICI